MSFSFAAAGSRDDVVAQLRATRLEHGGQLAEDARQLLIKTIGADEPQSVNGSEFRYAVEASGHSGPGYAASLNITVKPVWVAVPGG